MSGRWTKLDMVRLKPDTTETGKPDNTETGKPDNTDTGKPDNTDTAVGAGSGSSGSVRL